MPRRIPAGLCVGLCASLLWLTPPASAQDPVVSGDRFVGLRWTFVRIKYSSWQEEGSSRTRLNYWNDP